MPAARLARCLKEGFVYQGEPSRHRGGKLRGTPSADLPPTAFVLFLQNHDQVGNRAFGERLDDRSPIRQRSKPPSRLQLLCPQIPLIFMGEETASEHAVSFLHRPQRRTGARGARRQAPRILQASGNSAIRCSCRKSPIRTRPRRSTAQDRVADASARDSRQDLYRTTAHATPQAYRSSPYGARALDAQAVGAAAVSAQLAHG